MVVIIISIIRTLLRDAEVIMVRGRRYGLVGRNGIGKTTFLRAISW